MLIDDGGTAVFGLVSRNPIIRSYSWAQTILEGLHPYLWRIATPDGPSTILKHRHFTFAAPCTRDFAEASRDV